MSFDPYSIDLPIRDCIAEVQTKLSDGNTLIVNAPPGAGKSTLLPLALLNEAWPQGKKILMLEPRRLAAKTIAQRMASLLGEEVGETIGYRIRFESCTGPKTRIEVLTEGILTRMLHSDNSLVGVALVVFDEFHERSIHADVAMALCREAQQKLRSDLRILVMSATLDMPALSKMLKAPVVQSMGRQYPVVVHYTGDTDEMLLPEMTSNIIHKALRANKGDILVFLPGEGEIKKVEELLKKDLRDVAIHPLFGQLAPSKQFSALMPNRQGKRKIVLATSIAETSLTIEGISVVVDTGFGRTSRFDPASGLSRLETIRISKDSADQRAGRAGRLSPGVCYRLWSESSHQRMTEHRSPEIVEADLCPLVLDMAQWGVLDISRLTWLTPPPSQNLSQATETLTQLGATINGRVTEHGKKIHDLPCHPRIAHMMLMAQQDGKLALATDLAAVLEERDPMPRDTGIDINIRIAALRRYRREDGKGKAFGKVEKIARSYRQLFETSPANETVEPYETGVLLAHGFPERIAFARPGNNAQFQLANGKYAQAGHKDELAHEPWLAVANLDARQGMGKIFLASPLNPKDLKSLVKEVEVIKWDPEDGELTASKDLRIGSIVLKSVPLPEPDPKHLPKAISDFLKKEGEEFLNFSPEFTQWQNRVMSLRAWRPQENWPDLSTQTLLLTNWEWLAPHLAEIETEEDLFELDLLEILGPQLDTDKSQQLENYAPQVIETEDLKTLPLLYQNNGEGPILEVNLLDLANWKNMPTVNEGKIQVILHAFSAKTKKVHVLSELSQLEALL